MGIAASVLPGMVAWNNLFALPDMAGQDRTGYTVADEWYFPGLPPDPVEIPYTWLSPPLAFRPDRPLTTASVSRTGGSTARASDAASLAEHGENNFATTLDTATEADPANLASWVVTFYAIEAGLVPRSRMSSVRLRLNNRTPTEQWRILGVGEGTRISITGAPTRWPEGATQQVVEGITHVIGDEARDVEWRTSPVIGTAQGVAGPWFRWDYSDLDGPDLIPF